MTFLQTRAQTGGGRFVYATICLQVNQLIKELLWLTNYTCDSIKTAGKTLHVQVLLSTTTTERQNWQKNKKKLHRLYEETRATTPKLQSERHNYREGLRPACLSAG